SGFRGRCKSNTIRPLRNPPGLRQESEERQMSGRSRRDFLKVAMGGAGAGARLPRGGRAAGKKKTVFHGKAFIPPFHQYIKTTLAQQYEKETGIRIVYEVTAVGSLPTRIATITETGSGADVTMNGLLQVIQFGDKYVDVTDLCKEIGEKSGGWYDAGREA